MKEAKERVLALRRAEFGLPAEDDHRASTDTFEEHDLRRMVAALFWPGSFCVCMPK